MAAKKSTPTDSGKSKGKKGKTPKGQFVVATNRKARHDYHIIDTYECGVVLVGTEVKALREGKASLVDAYATIDESEVWLRGLHIPEYSMGHWTNHSPRRTRKLLLNKRALGKLFGAVQQKGYACVALSLYWKKHMIKCEIALAKGKKQYDKRHALREKQDEREKQAQMSLRYQMQRGR